RAARATKTVAPLRAEHSLLLTLARGLDVPNLEHGMGRTMKTRTGLLLVLAVGLACSDPPRGGPPTPAPAGELQPAPKLPPGVVASPPRPPAPPGPIELENARPGTTAWRLQRVASAGDR